MPRTEFDWIVIGGGAAGIAVGEILTRVGMSVLIIERHPTLAAETTKIFHEWLHTGTLYTLVPDSLKTTRYLLGAIDDLFEYYSGFRRMNLAPRESGFSVESDGWFNPVNIRYKYRARPFNPIWSLAVARACWLIEEIKAHDWLRRRAGSIHDGYRFNLPHILRKYPSPSPEFNEVVSPDVTINSRVLLTDLLRSFESTGGVIKAGLPVERLKDHGGRVEVETAEGTFTARRVAICCADGVSKFTQTTLKISYAPMFVVDGLPAEAESFVELDFFVKRCINLLTKGDGLGQAGGISVGSQDEVPAYLHYCIEMHKKRNPSIRVLDSYVGLKKELVGRGQDRNYLYHVNAISGNVWSVILGKFTLMFSLGPEFIRRIYHKNPPRSAAANEGGPYERHPLLCDPTWLDIVKQRLARGEEPGTRSIPALDRSTE